MRLAAPLRPSIVEMIIGGSLERIRREEECDGRMEGVDGKSGRTGLGVGRSFFCQRIAQPPPKRDTLSLTVCHPDLAKQHQNSCLICRTQMKKERRQRHKGTILKFLSFASVQRLRCTLASLYHLSPAFRHRPIHASCQASKVLLLQTYFQINRISPDLDSIARADEMSFPAISPSHVWNSDRERKEEKSS